MKHIDYEEMWEMQNDRDNLSTLYKLVAYATS